VGIEFDPEAMARSLAQTFGLVQQEFMRRGIEKREKAWVIETEERGKKRQIAREGRAYERQIETEERGVKAQESFLRKQQLYARDLSKYNIDLQLGTKNILDKLEFENTQRTEGWKAQFTHDLNQYFGSQRFQNLLEEQRGGNMYQHLSAAAMDKNRLKLLSGVPLTPSEIKIFPKDIQGQMSNLSGELKHRNDLRKIDNKYKNMMVEKMRSEIAENNAQADALMYAKADPTKLINTLEKDINKLLNDLNKISSSDEYFALSSQAEKGALDPKSPEKGTYDRMVATIKYWSQMINDKQRRIEHLEYLALSSEQRSEVDKLDKTQAAKLEADKAEAEAAALNIPEEDLETMIMGLPISDTLIKTLEKARGGVIGGQMGRLAREIKSTVKSWKKKYKKDILTQEEMTELRQTNKLEEGMLFASPHPDAPNQGIGLFRVIRDPETGAWSVEQIE
jgi:hypothetical protein